MLNSRKALCAFCGSKMKVYTQKHFGLLNFIGVAALSTYIMYLVWSDFDLRVLIVFVCLSFLGELIVHFRWRLSMQCKSCGFDPVLYKRSQKAASERVKVHLERRKADPTAFLKPLPHLPTRKKESKLVKTDENRLNLQA